MAATFTGTLNTNEIVASLYNMIISIQTFADPIQHTYSDLVDAARVDGTLYGDTKLYVSTNALKSVPWAGDSEAANLLKLHRPPAPKVEKITLDVFRMVVVTVDEYLSKRAWQNEGDFSQFNAVILAWIGTTKRIYETTLYNVFVGTTLSDQSAATAIKNAQNVAVALTNRTGLTDPSELEAANRTDALTIYKALADILVNVKDALRVYNDNGFLRAYDPARLKVVWKASVYNGIRYLDKPTIFHKDEALADVKETVLPDRYFGTVTSAAVSTANNNGTYRSVYEADYATAANQPVVHVFPGDLIPASTSLVTSLNDNGTAAAVSSSGIPAGQAYTENAKLLFKIIADEDMPIMSAFEAGTSFFNPRSLTTTNYLIWAHNTLAHLSEYPLITVSTT
ncbi:MAG: hypothetical protein IKY18_03635 [Oscillospiraceae bacterium]|nr:hypothetical protein [Oscillospiraceae bacterium]